MIAKRLGIGLSVVGLFVLGCSAEGMDPESGGEGEPIAVETEALTSCPPVLKTWNDPNVYPANANPYKRPGIFHAMSYPSTPVIFTPAARIGEICTYRAGDYHFQTIIKSSCNPPLGCVGICQP